MSSNKVYLTEKGLDEIKQELDYLKLEKRPEVIEALKNLVENKNIEEERKQLVYNRTAGMEITAALKAISELDRGLNDNVKRLSDTEKKLQETSETMQQKQQEFRMLETYSEDHKKLFETKGNLENRLKRFIDGEKKAEGEAPAVEAQAETAE